MVYDDELATEVDNGVKWTMGLLAPQLVRSVHILHTMFHQTYILSVTLLQLVDAGICHAGHSTADTESTRNIFAGPD